MDKFLQIKIAYKPHCLQIIGMAILSFCFIQLHAQGISENIKINQLGYYPYANKLAIITGLDTAHNFYVVNKANNTIALTGKLGPVKQSLYSSTQTRFADFSKLSINGQYYIKVPGLGVSYSFSIKDHVYHALGVAALKAFYYQRASMPLVAKYAGKWNRAEGHPDNKVIIHPSAAGARRPAGAVIATPGGWYDAGDYNKYVVNSGISTGTLLSAYEDFPAYFKSLKTNIPESVNNTPDILNEALYNLRWMLTMQDPNDGGVYNKCTNAAFDKMIMPALATQPRYVVQKGTAATLDFAAVMAQSARIFKKFNKQYPGLADSCLTASAKAWQWALLNPALQYDQTAINKLYEPKIVTGAYGDKVFADEWFWAAAELFATTGKSEYYNVLSKGVNSVLTVPSWSNVQMLGYYALLHADVTLPASAKNTVGALKGRLIAFANNLLKHVNDSAFHTIMGQSKADFIWGSNAVAANQGIVLINAYLITHDKKYIDNALTNLHYLLGLNATGYCFITGAGSKSPMHPHHRPSIADGITEPVPGLMVAGPNPGMQDGTPYPFSEPETAYSDADGAYASNEIAINWNAPFVYLVNAAGALEFAINKTML